MSTDFYAKWEKVFDITPVQYIINLKLESEKSIRFRFACSPALPIGNKLFHIPL